MWRFLPDSLRSRVPMDGRNDPALVVVAWRIAVLVSGVALYVLRARRMRLGGTVLAGLLRLAGIVAVLYIVAVTASAMAEDRIACLDAGMNHHIAKQVTEEALVTALALARRA